MCTNTHALTLTHNPTHLHVNKLTHTEIYMLNLSREHANFFYNYANLTFSPGYPTGRYNSEHKLFEHFVVAKLLYNYK